MDVNSHVDAEAVNAPISRKFAARLLGMSTQTLLKAVQGGVIPEITSGNLSVLAAIPVLTSVRTDGGSELPVLRFGEQAPSTWDAYTPPRTYQGFGASMTDPEALAAADRWWTASGSGSVLDAGGMIAALGGWTTLLLGVSGIAQQRPGGGNCLHYNARLIARCDSVINQQVRIIDPTHPFAARAHDILGKRVPGGGGGSITRLATEETL